MEVVLAEVMRARKRGELEALCIRSHNFLSGKTAHLSTKRSRFWKRNKTSRRSASPDSLTLTREGWLAGDSEVREDAMMESPRGPPEARKTESF